jgi:LmbE family N-acetylglucosaminyl deacetylase
VTKILVVAPHPDDETLGCGGTLLKHRMQGDELHWYIATRITEAAGFTAERVKQREAEIEAVARAYPFAAVHSGGFETMQLDRVAMRELIGSLSRVMQQVQPERIYLPYRNDAHSDHAAVFDATVACCKTFRYPSIRSVHAYETLSETEFGLRPDDSGFRPNLFVDCSSFLERKIEIMAMFAGEMAPFPFPRSPECIRAQAMLRGSQAGVHAAEAFMTLKEIR